MKAIGIQTALCALLIASAREAHADPPPSSYVAVVVAPETPIASNGAILVSSGSPGGLADPYVVVRTDGASAPIEGTLMKLPSGYWSWRPAEPLAPGSYLVSTQAFGQAPLTEQQVTFSDELAPEKPEISVTAVPTVMDYVDRLNCCSYDDKAVGDGQCFPDVTEHTLYVHHELTSTSSAIALHQFLFRIFTLGSGPGYATTAAAVNASSTVVYYEQAAEYCAVIEAIDIATQTVHTFPELSPLCIPHGAMGIVGYDAFEYDQADLDRRNCDMPPVSLVGPWCDYNRDACEPLDFDELIANDCRFYDTTCEGGEVPEPGGARDGGVLDSGAVDDGTSAPPKIDASVPDDSPGSQGGAGSDAVGGAAGSRPPSAGPQQTSDRDRAAPDGCGCTIASARDAPAGLAPAALTLLLVLAARRVRRGLL